MQTITLVSAFVRYSAQIDFTLITANVEMFDAASKVPDNGVDWWLFFLLVFRN